MQSKASRCSKSICFWAARLTSSALVVIFMVIMMMMILAMTTMMMFEKVQVHLLLDRASYFQCPDKDDVGDEVQAFEYDCLV